jgi:anti-anti-sigma factor
MTSIQTCQPIKAPVRLNADSRDELRSAVAEHLSHGVTEAEPLVIDLGATREIDAAGLGTLVVAQRQARERGRPTWLLETRPHVRSLLGRTRLDTGFEFKGRSEVPLG